MPLYRSSCRVLGRRFYFCPHIPLHNSLYVFWTGSLPADQGKEEAKTKKTNEFMDLLERRNYILSHPEKEYPGTEQELDNLETRLAALREMVSDGAKEQIKYIKNSFEKRKTKPAFMYDEELAEQIFPFIKEIYPEVIMSKWLEVQYFAATDRQKKTLRKLMRDAMGKRIVELAEIQKAIEELEKNIC